MKVHKNALFHTKYLTNFLEMGHSPLSRPHPRWEEVHLLSRPYPLGTDGTSTPRWRRGLDAFVSCSRRLREIVVLQLQWTVC